MLGASAIGELRAARSAAQSRLVLVPRCRLRYALAGSVLSTILHCDISPGIELAFIARIDVRHVRERLRVSGERAPSKVLPNHPHGDPLGTKRWDAYAFVSKPHFLRDLQRAFEAYARTLGYSHDNPPPAQLWGAYVAYHVPAGHGVLDKIASAVKPFAKAATEAVATVVIPGAGGKLMHEAIKAHEQHKTLGQFMAGEAITAAKLAGASQAMKLASAAVSALPNAPHLAPALDAARGMLVAMHAAKLGDPRAKQALFYAARKAQQGDPAAQPGARMAAKVYRLAVLPA